MSRGTSQGGLIDAIRYDIAQLHTGWMALFFPRQRQQSHSVLGKWRPQSTSGKVAYSGWSIVGSFIVALLYPFVLFGFATRYYTSKIDRTAASLGVLGVILLSAVVWGGLAALAKYRFSTEGFYAVAAAGGVATVAAALAYLTSRYGGRITTVLFAYPFGMTAIFLPPVVAALYSPTLSNVIFPNSTNLAVWLLDNVLTYRNIDEVLRARFNLEGFAYVGMWFGIAVPVGWVLGFLVTLANLMRPKSA
ncbi:hypothetical protein NKF26_09325 [Haladaptatus sp. AB618]|uniref:hypothetical protein n=1 Tax=Haladaptatus sp. AB618 TaxID=2934173 RepID=UPI00209C2B7A|nr:hypothetical protein [Haladaptatus sp. AB618]MCO8254000.1 hypothetical protein [Haladaptatus sp. AB618]